MTTSASNPGLKGVNWSQYASWPSFVGTDGHTYYIPPGGQGYAYDPFLNHLFQDGRANAAAAKQATDDAAKAQKDANSPVRQFGTIGGIAGLTAGIPIAANRLFPSALEQAQTNLIASKIPAAGAQAVAPNASAAANGALGTTADLGVPDFSVNAGASSGYSLLPGASADASTVAAPQVVGAAPVASDGVIGSVLPSSAGFSGLGFGPLAAIAAGTYLGGKSAWDEFHGKTDNSIPGIVGRATLGIATGGLSEVARPFLNHQTTRDYQKENTQSLLSQSDDPTWQGYVSAMRGQNETGPSDASMPYSDTHGNKYANFEDYKKGGLDASNLTGVQGNLATYGPEWAKLTEAQRQQITQKNIDSNLYSSHKGEVVIDDPIVAKQNYDSVVGPTVVTPPGAVPASNVHAAVNGAQPVVQLPGQRTTTLSPGIGLNGQRIRY